MRRRLFRGCPQSLLLKGGCIAAHGGGKRFETDSEPYRVLLSWIEQGATRKVAGEPRIESVALEQADFSLVPEQSRNLRVVARYTDGTSRNVTSLSTYLSNDPAVVSVNDQGVLKAGSLPGETAIMTRYMNHICV